ncbi:MAG: hypothetical protein AB7O32_10585 [Vicinamibacterales bacterium]
MSKHNKVNPDHYHQGGRLTPDEAARERKRQQQAPGGRVPGPPETPPELAPPTRRPGRPDVSPLGPTSSGSGETDLARSTADTATSIRRHTDLPPQTDDRDQPDR